MIFAGNFYGLASLHLDFLPLAIETLTDLGNHIVADLNLGEVNW
jgi:hypothetical protein